MLKQSKTIVFVLAGSFRQFQHYVREQAQQAHSNADFRYISRPHDIMGINNATLRYVGEYWKNPLCDSPTLRFAIQDGRIKE